MRSTNTYSKDILETVAAKLYHAFKDFAADKPIGSGSVVRYDDPDLSPVQFSVMKTAARALKLNVEFSSQSGKNMVRGSDSIRARNIRDEVRFICHTNSGKKQEQVVPQIYKALGEHCINR